MPMSRSLTRAFETKLDAAAKLIDELKSEVNTEEPGLSEIDAKLDTLQNLRDELVDLKEEYDNELADEDEEAEEEEEDEEEDETEG